MKSKNAFTLVELLIYTGIIAIVGSLFGGVLVNVTRVQNRQTASGEVNQQLNFALQNIQRLIRDSSTIDVASGISTTTLRLYMKEGARDLTQIYVENNKVYIKERSTDPNPLIIPLTGDAVKVDSLSFLKISSYPGHDSVQIDLAITTNTDNPQQNFSQTLTSAVARVSAATFDADLIPGASNNYDIGLAANRWKNLYLSGDLTIGGKTTMGNLASDPAGVNGMIYYNTTSKVFRGYQNGSWSNLTAGGGPWTTSGNDIYNNNTGNVGVGNNAPAKALDVVGEIRNVVSGTEFYTVPKGGIIMWSGATIPPGWALCDGTNGTPDLRGQFIMGKANVSDNGTGGSATHTHTAPGITNKRWKSITDTFFDGNGNSLLGSKFMPNYSPTSEPFGTNLLDPSITTITYEHNNPARDPGVGAIRSVNQAYDYIDNPGGSGRNQITWDALYDNSIDPASNIPPYYKLAFIMRL